MKTIPKDPHNCQSQAESSLLTSKQQIEVMMSIKDLLNSKLQYLNQLISDEVSGFVYKFNPQKLKLNKFNDLEVQGVEVKAQNTLGYLKISEFKQSYMQLSSSLRNSIEGICLELDKYPFTKILSKFITSTILRNFTRFPEMMLQRQHILEQEIKQLNENFERTEKKFLKNKKQFSHCSICSDDLNRDKISNIRSQLLNGDKLSWRIGANYKLDSEEKQESSDEELFKNDKQSNFKGKLLTTEKMRYTLSKLENNLEQRKYDILTCLTELGSFSQFISISNDNTISDKQPTEQPDLQPIKHVPQKFNHNEFIFKIGTHFNTYLKTLQEEIKKIKKKYFQVVRPDGSLQFTKDQATMCETDKEYMKMQFEKFRRKLDAAHSIRIEELKKQNYDLLRKVSEFNALKNLKIFQKIDDEKKEVSELTVQMRIQKLVEKYETNINSLNSEILRLKIELSKSQTTHSDKSDLQQQLNKKGKGGNLQSKATDTKQLQSMFYSEKLPLKKNNKKVKITGKRKQDSNGSENRISIFEDLIGKIHTSFVESEQRESSSALVHSKTSLGSGSRKELPLTKKQSRILEEILRIYCKPSAYRRIHSEVISFNTANMFKHPSPQQNSVQSILRTKSKKRTLQKIPSRHKILLQESKSIEITSKIDFETENSHEKSVIPIQNENERNSQSTHINKRKTKLVKLKSSSVSRENITENNTKTNPISPKQKSNNKANRRYISEHTSMKKGNSLGSRVSVKKPQAIKKEQRSSKLESMLSQNNQTVNVSENFTKTSIKNLQEKQHSKNLLQKKRRKTGGGNSQQNLINISSTTKQNESIVPLSLKRLEEPFNNTQIEKKSYIVDYFPKLSVNIDDQKEEEIQVEILGPLATNIQSLFFVSDRQSLLKPKKSAEDSQQIEENHSQNKKTDLLNLDIVNQASCFNPNEMILKNEQVSISTKIYTRLVHLKVNKSHHYEVLKELLQRLYSQRQEQTKIYQWTTEQNKGNLKGNKNNSDSKIMKSAEESHAAVTKTKGIKSCQQVDLKLIVDYVIMLHTKLCQKKNPSVIGSKDVNREKKSEALKKSQKSQKKDPYICPHLQSFVKLMDQHLQDLS